MFTALSSSLTKDLEKLSPLQAVAELCGHDLWSDQSIEAQRAERWKLAESFLGLERLFDDNEGWNENGMMAKL
ncbi:hypothetical protein PHYBLDRAFT_146452 [Phycomyces blakesleeanus NRRL 1555(-)]|uniref:Uncharacterized protein n=1 Tax=Phycomyces blakesleeanus (strain ATCC 8743b / DSM 1359 / FGSC 10004 / NBRC 33097 / NRRL 1555) TaxID=763407 RepID=A0A162N934_PHYB8|nr:hypothetical protein PHYBLDRAFT_146452 [Phycomyces blakesleeanus NRRL 1555(-)]OAD72248.1 hypothetical protein PHYBLDRAFT_146452 [Phycomyces blakesleeanus NRRL 1555(-)]|eukprot:XP_018290288.1 hypothetical protein PHYBLDRAFT_146452 [Phycomyces blakesleeanus NRRL 1555(-)]